MLNADRGKVAQNSWNNRQATSAEDRRHEKKIPVAESILRDI